jgi:hypothetical protein
MLARNLNHVSECGAMSIRGVRMWRHVYPRCPSVVPCLSAVTECGAMSIRGVRVWRHVYPRCPSVAPCLSADCCFSDLALSWR